MTKPTPTLVIEPSETDGCAAFERSSLTHALQSALAPFSASELQAAAEPHPHLYRNGARALLPVGEVTVLAAPGREGKTFTIVGLVVAYVTDLIVGEMRACDSAGKVLIYSAEDDRKQYARKLLAATNRLATDAAEKVRGRIVVPDLSAEGMEALQTLISIAESRQAMPTTAFDAIVAALKNQDVDLLVFETASTLSDADETNPSFRVLIRTLKKIARAVGCAVLLTHHTSQIASQSLPMLDISTNDVRGGRALVDNARQVALLVNLGSEGDPFPGNDARTVLRRMVLPNVSDRVSAWITLDTSKAANPPPIFFRWVETLYGPWLEITPPQREYAGLSWTRLHGLEKAERARSKQVRRDSARDSKVAEAIDAVRVVQSRGKPATVKAISVAAGHGAEWGVPYLAAAVDAGKLTVSREQVPRTRDPVDVYRVVDQSISGQ